MAISIHSSILLGHDSMVSMTALRAIVLAIGSLSGVMGYIVRGWGLLDILLSSIVTMMF